MAPLAASVALIRTCTVTGDAGGVPAAFRTAGMVMGAPGARAVTVWAKVAVTGPVGVAEALRDPATCTPWSVTEAAAEFPAASVTWTAIGFGPRTIGTAQLKFPPDRDAATPWQVTDATPERRSVAAPVIVAVGKLTRAL